MTRTIYQDRYNPLKTWEVTRLSGGFFLRQFIAGKQWGKGLRTTKKWLEHIGILNFEIVNK